MSAYVARVVGTDAKTGFQIAVNNDGDAFYVTPCCEASAKGCDGYTGCRACYEPVDPRLGDIAPTEWYAPHRRAKVDETKQFLSDLVLKSMGLDR